MRFPTISLTTDFGLRDPYVAEMKAVILNICAKARIVDISHEIKNYDVQMGAFTLACAAPYFSRGAIHVAVVDPGVGTARKPIIIQTRRGYYVGPDNGILTLAAENDSRPRSIYKIANTRFTLSRVSNTFHGRDIFASAAAHLANGTPPTEFGPKISKINILGFARIAKKPGELVGKVIHIDHFGNIITNIQSEDIQDVQFPRANSTITIKIKNTELDLKVCETYTDVPPHKPLALFGGHNFLEISLNQDSAARIYRVMTGDKITIQLDRKYRNKTKRNSAKASV